MFKQVLVPLDGSELSERALPYARRIATASGATLHLVYVTPDLHDYSWVPGALTVADTLAQAEEETGREMRVYLEGWRTRLSAEGLHVQIEVLSGNVADSLLDYEQKAAIDLVVICSHGRSGLSRFALGSIAERLLRHGQKPILIVKASGSLPDLEKAVVPLDGSARAEEELQLIAGLAPSLVKHITLLRVVSSADESIAAESYLREIAQRLPQGLTAEAQVVVGDEPAQVISEVAGKQQLVVMATHGRSQAARWITGSVAQDVEHAGSPAVLLVRAR
ncbi:universal stress protein [Ktedonosporobacter rubrisoli]|nr:universal stress protein [Ktedonosporobacter rubrisoli]